MRDLNIHFLFKRFPCRLRIEIAFVQKFSDEVKNGFRH